MQTQLIVSPAKDASVQQFNSVDPAAIKEVLAAKGVSFEQWNLRGEFQPGADSEEILTAYSEDISGLQANEGYQAVDVVSLNADNPNIAVLRKKFLTEHTHAEDEVRYFVAGEGLFYIHLKEEVLLLRCTAGDLIRVPAGTRHWFDTGPEPAFIAIRLFTDPQGWVAENTGDDIASKFPTLDEI